MNAGVLFDGVRPYLKGPILGTFGLGMAAGFPLTFVISLMGIWLSRFGVSKGDVGLFALITTFYTWKFLWSPAIDRVPLGFITKRLGRRRGWLITIQVAMTAAIWAIAGFNPADDLMMVAVLASLIAFLSASQDIVIDAYRIEITNEDEQGYSAAAYVYGYRVANFLAGVGVLTIADQVGWAVGIALLPIFLLPGLIAVLYLGEPDNDKVAPDDKIEKPSFLENFHTAVVMPFQEFTSRSMWWLILLFILFFKAGDAVISIMTSPLIVEMGFSDLDIAYANKTVGFITLMIGVGLGAALYKLIGMYRALFITGILMMVTNLGFAWLASGEAESWRLAVTIGLENFATGLGTTVTIAYMAGLCNANFTATQFALLSSLAGQARTILGAPSGFVAEAVGWVEFFIYATFLAVPGLVLLFILWRMGAAEAVDINGEKEAA